MSMGKALRIILLGFALPAALAVAVVTIGVTFDASRLRATLAETVSKSLGRPVTIEGPMVLTVGLRPAIRVEDLRIENPPGFPGKEFARIGKARLSLRLFPLLRNELAVDEVSGSDVRIRLERDPSGRPNWHITGAQPAAGNGSEADRPEKRGPRIALAHVAAERVSVEYAPRPGTVRHFALDTLEGDTLADRSVALRLAGSVDERFAYTLELLAKPSAGHAAGMRESWAFELSFAFLDSALHATGEVADPFGEPSAEIRFGLGIDRFEQVERLLQLRLPRPGPSAFAGTLAWRRGMLVARELNATAGDTVLTGEIRLETDPARPKLSGALSVPQLDLRPFLVGERSERPRSLLDTWRELEQVTIPLQALTALDVDLRLEVGRWLSLPGDARDASVHLRIEDGRLAAPLQASIAGVVMQGEARADARAAPPRFDLALRAERTPLADLGRLLFGASDLEGTLGRFDLRVAGEGQEVRDLARGLAVELDLAQARLSYGHGTGERPVSFSLDTFELKAGPGQPVVAKARGALLGSPLRAAFEGGELAGLVRDGRMPLRVDAQAAGVRFGMSGTLAPAGPQDGPEIGFGLTAERSGALAGWLGLDASGKAPIALQGQARVRRGETALRDASLVLGRSVVTANVEIPGEGRRGAVRARLSAAMLDADELRAVLPRRKADAGRPIVEIPILPAGIDLTDSDLEVRVERIDGFALPVTELAFDGRMRGGVLLPSSFSARLADIAFTGALGLDLRGKEPTAGLWLSAREVDLGALARRLGYTRDIDATLDLLQLHADLRASRLGDLLQRSVLVGNIEGGRITVRDRNTKGELRVRLDAGEFGAQAGQPLRAKLSGQIGDAPVELTLESGRLHEFVTGTRWPFALQAQAAGGQLVVAGSAAPLADRRDVELTLAFTGERLDHLSGLTATSLPPWGPYALAGWFRIGPQGYEVRDARLRIGDSVADGKGLLDTTVTPPRLEASLRAEQIQLDDFDFRTWSPFEKKSGPPAQLTVREARAAASAGSQKVQALLSPEALSRQDALITLAVERVQSGSDRLGDGRLTAKIQHGRAEFGPATVNVPGGSALMSLGYAPDEDEVAVSARVRVERFDYGILARRIAPETDLAGLFSLDLRLDGRTPRLADIFGHADGRIDFAIWPRRMHAGVFDLWATNLLVALAPAVDPEADSRVNCAIGRFVLRDGRLNSERILMDTTNVRVTGTGAADFTRETIALRLRPQPKVPQFFTLATPIEVGGTFENHEIGVTGAGAVETVVRLLGSLIVVPIQKLAAEPVPADGSDVCAGRFGELALP